MPQRQDFVQRLLDELKQLLGEVLKFRQAGSHDAALMSLLHAQERLFVRPIPEFMGLPIERQVRLLVIGEAAAAAREKCVIYSTLLTEMGRTYQAKGQVAHAQGAYQLALHVLLLAANQFATPDPGEFRPRITALRQLLPAEQLQPEVATLLQRFDETT